MKRRRRRDHVAAVAQAARERGLDLTQIHDFMEWRKRSQLIRAREQVKREARKFRRQQENDGNDV